jgi:hypothetical protein
MTGIERPPPSLFLVFVRVCMLLTAPSKNNKKSINANNFFARDVEYFCEKFF